MAPCTWWALRTTTEAAWPAHERATATRKSRLARRPVAGDGCGRARPRWPLGPVRPRRRCRRSDSAPPETSTAGDRTGSRDVACSIDSARMRSSAAHTWIARTSADLRRSWATSSPSARDARWQGGRGRRSTVSRGSPIRLVPAVISQCWRLRRRPPGTRRRVATPRRSVRHRPPRAPPARTPARRARHTVRTASSTGMPAASSSQHASRSCSANGIRTPWRTAADSSSAASYHPAPLPPAPRRRSGAPARARRGAATAPGRTRRGRGRRMGLAVVGEHRVHHVDQAGSTPVRSSVLIASPIRGRSRRAAPRWSRRAA